jgi:Arc/MetJ family transcription regulator
MDRHTRRCMTKMTSIRINDDLLTEAQRLGGHVTKREAVESALQAYTNRLRRRRASQAFGTFDFNPEYDYKAERARR